MGCCGSELHAQWLSDIKEITGYEQTGCTLSMFANRLSFFFDFKGPSKAVDTGTVPFSTLCVLERYHFLMFHTCSACPCQPQDVGVSHL